MNSVTWLLVLTYWKSEIYNSILIIVDRLTKMAHSDQVKVTIKAPGLAKVMINVLARHHRLPN